VRATLPLVAAALVACSEPATGTLHVRVLDEAVGTEVPARLELRDEQGRAWVAEDAIPLRFECLLQPLPDWAAERVSISRELANPHTGTTQFYVDGSARIALPVGRYRLRAFRGIEYEVAEQDVEIAGGREQTASVALRRWIDLAAEGWWSADDHLHITRRTPEDDRRIADWMRAEDLHVANLLQMGTVDQFGVTPQHDFGAAGEFRLDGTLLLAGQEHPRTHFLGHTITLAADTAIDLRDTYIAYDTFWRAAERAHGLPGYAHFGMGPARDGLTLDAARGLVFFLEVLQFELPYYDTWYDLLNLGLRLTPTAGTDFPCGPAWSIPGRERFYTRLEAAPTRESWREAVRAGRTFVTNGPLVDLRVGAAQIGDEIVLDAAAPLEITGTVRFDPTRDDVQQVELLRNGDPIPAPVERVGPGELRVRVRQDVADTAWFALRVSGDKVGEAPIQPGFPSWAVDAADRYMNFREQTDRSEAYYAGRGRVRPSAAHSAAIWVTLRGSAPVAAQPRGQELARAALARLDELESRLSDQRIADQTLWDWLPYSDGVSLEHLRRNRPALLAAIAEARARHQALLDGAPR
jgi:hypothetical protein